jgi:hypothetical protein
MQEWLTQAVAVVDLALMTSIKQGLQPQLMQLQLVRADLVSSYFDMEFNQVHQQSQGLLVAAEV